MLNILTNKCITRKHLHVRLLVPCGQIYQGYAAIKVSLQVSVMTVYNLSSNKHQFLWIYFRVENQNSTSSSPDEDKSTVKQPGTCKLNRLVLWVETLDLHFVKIFQRVFVQRPLKRHYYFHDHCLDRCHYHYHYRYHYHYHCHYLCYSWLLLLTRLFVVLINSMFGLYHFSVQDICMVWYYLSMLFKLVLSSEKLLRGPLFNMIFHRKV